MITDVVAQLRQKLKEPVLEFLFQRLVRSKPQVGRRSPFGWEELKLLREAVVSQNLCCIGGSMVAALEREFAEAYGSPYAVASTSGTAAIHVALGALDLNPGDEVITAPITDLGTIIPILYQGAIPVFADVDDTYNMDPSEVERQITSRTRAIIVVHLFGNPCDMDAMLHIAKRHKIPLIEDCAQAHFAEYKAKYTGTIGDIGCFSFQQSKHMTTGDGGMTITGNKAYYERMKLFADKGYARKGWGSRAYLFHAPNYRMTELVGAVGLAQLKKVRGVVSKRRELGQYMTELLQGLDGLQTAPTTPGAQHSYWLYPIALKGIDADQFGAAVRRAQVNVSIRYTGKAIYLCTESLTAKKTYGDSQYPFSCRPDRQYEYSEGLCPRAERALDQLVCLPLDETWTRGEVERVARVISATLKSMTTGQDHPVMVAPEQVSSTTADRRNGIHGQREAKQIAIGIIGCGQMGRWHLDAYRKNGECRVVAVADTDLVKAQALAAEIGGRAYRSHTEMIARERLDGVSICTVPVSHRNIAVDVLRARTHVLCEKPLAVSVDEAQEMLAVAEAHKLLLFTAFKFRFYDEVLRAKELIERGSLGRILSFRLMFGGYIDMAGTWYSQKELSGGGVIMDNGPHAIDLIRFVFGELRIVNVRTLQVQELDVEDTAQLTVTTDGGAVGTVDLSWSSSVPARTYLEIYGEDGTALLDSEGLTYKCKAWREWKRIPNELTGTAAFARQIDHFVGSIAGEPPTRVTNQDGLAAQIVIHAAYESANSEMNVSPSGASSVALEGALAGR
jgi:dTDP-4-amino-4,6-dideoxygalactose transaminase/predicted dehydrogenase